MANEYQNGNKIPDWAGSGKTNGVKIDAGPYIGIIKNNADSARLGRLDVWIPEISGNENDPTKYYTVRYASPFFGSTQGLPGSDDAGSFGTEQQTYGFWAIPPDIGNRVLITFVMGDPGRGYWFACIPNTPSQYMVPGIARNIDNTKINVDKIFGDNRVVAESYLPSSELVQATKDKDTDPKFYELPKVIHSYQANIVINQGLDKDPLRGTITSSSQRESPSCVIGLSTPGRSNPDTADFPNLDELLKKGDQGLKISTIQSFPSRKGGHSFVLDDGNIYGESRLVRLRTAAGHQILMHDTANVIYVINSLGTAWVELTPEGSINIFSDASVNVRSNVDINFHADSNVNIHAGDTIKMYAEKNILQETQTYRTTATQSYSLNAAKVGVISGSSLLMKSVTGGWKCSGELKLKGSKIYMNTAGKVPEEPEVNDKFEFYKQEDTKYNSDLKLWEKNSEKYESIVPFAPSHEPWTRQSGVLKKLDGTVVPATPQTPQ